MITTVLQIITANNNLVISPAGGNPSLRMARQQTVREMFDDISLNVLAFLEVYFWTYWQKVPLLRVKFCFEQNHRAVSKVQFVERPPATIGTFAIWEHVTSTSVLRVYFQSLICILAGQ